jgi:aminopeptidase N
VHARARAPSLLQAFHAADGAGYAFVGDVVLRVDKTNNQIAARLAGSFSLWRKYGPARQALMRAQLERIRDSAGVSKDVYEIASKSLA